MISRHPYHPGAYDDDFEDVPLGGVWRTWGLGLLLAAVIAAFGVHAVWTRTVDYESARASEHLVGARAVAVGVAQLGIALLLFCHYFIQNWRPLAWYAVLGKITALLMIIGGLGYYCVRWVIR